MIMPPSGPRLRRIRMRCRRRSNGCERKPTQRGRCAALRSNRSRCSRTRGQPIYVIQPVNPQVVYVPQYNPTVVYAGSGLNAGLITFGIGIGLPRCW